MLEMPRTQNSQYVQTGSATSHIINGKTCECGHTNNEGAKFCSKCGKAL